MSRARPRPTSSSRRPKRQQCAHNQPRSSSGCHRGGEFPIEHRNESVLVYHQVPGAEVPVRKNTSCSSRQLSPSGTFFSSQRSPPFERRIGGVVVIETGAGGGDETARRMLGRNVEASKKVNDGAG